MGVPRRDKDDRRSVGSHEKIMGALGRAAGWTRTNQEGFDFAVRSDDKGEVADKQLMGEHPHSYFTPGKSTATKFSTKEAAKNAYSSIIKGD